jgi:Mg2+ and Co2+ transporter CorA
LEKSESRIITSDEIAERLLNEKIEADFPSIVSMEKRMNALEDQMIMELGKEAE